MVTCKIDQEVSPKKLSETTRTDRENLKGGHLLSKYSANMNMYQVDFDWKYLFVVLIIYC